MRFIKFIIRILSELMPILSFFGFFLLIDYAFDYNVWVGLGIICFPLFLIGIVSIMPTHLSKHSKRK